MIDRPDVRLISLMDHTPGQRQFRDEVKLRDYYRGKRGGKNDAELDALFEKRFHYQKKYAAANMREIVVALAQRLEVPLASHDDTTEENVADAIRDRVSVAEFPTTIEAARGLHEAGIGILMGAPNVVRGGSHSGNIAAIDLAREGLSRYPVVRLHPVEPADGRAAVAGAHFRRSTWPHAVRTVTKAPAEAVGLDDRGEIAKPASAPI